MDCQYSDKSVIPPSKKGRVSHSEAHNRFWCRRVCMDSSYANETAMKMTIVAYNLVNCALAFRSKPKFINRIATLRFNCFAVGNRITKQSNETILKMSVSMKRRQWFDELFKNMGGRITFVSSL